MKGMDGKSFRKSLVVESPVPLLSFLFVCVAFPFVVIAVLSGFGCVPHAINAIGQDQMKFNRKLCIESVSFV
jgi:hypothetical protein